MGALTANSVQETNQGWQCPVCYKVNAPFVTECTCTTLKTEKKIGSTGNKGHARHLFAMIFEETPRK